MYQFLSRIGKTYFPKSQHKLFKFIFNASPMYRRSTGKVTSVTPGFWRVEVKIPLSYKNRNYAGTLFGGSLFSATDPIYFIQLVQILGKDYIVWDKSSLVKFKRPGTDDAFVTFRFEEQEIANLKARVDSEKEVDIRKIVEIKSRDGLVYCEIEKVIYVAEKKFYKEKKAQQAQKK
ncbi:MAG: DUF4442 domain-containing protein [Bacteroidota bacterium]